MRRSFIQPHIAWATSVLALCLIACTDRARNATTSDAVEQWSLVEDLRIGGDDAGPASFSKVHSVVEAPNGNVFVLEQQEQELRVFSKQGTFLRVAARRGEGPGEVTYATGMALGPDAIVVNDPRQRRFTLVDFDGRYVRHVLAASSGYGDVWRGAVDSLGRIIDFPVRTPIGGVDARTGYPRTEDRVRIISADGRADTVGGVTCGTPAPSHIYRARQGYVATLTLPFTASAQTVVTARGTVWCAPGSTYELLHASLGQPVRTLVFRDVPRIAVPPTVLDSTERSFRKFAGSIGTLIDDGGYRMPTTYPVLRQIDVDRDGRVWVRRYSDTTLAPIDVFDDHGVHIATVRVPHLLGDRLFISREHVYDVQLDANDVPVVVRYRIDGMKAATM